MQEKGVLKKMINGSVLLELILLWFASVQIWRVKELFVPDIVASTIKGMKVDVRPCTGGGF